MRDLFRWKGLNISFMYNIIVLYLWQCDFFCCFLGWNVCWTFLCEIWVSFFSLFHSNLLHFLSCRIELFILLSNPEVPRHREPDRSKASVIVYNRNWGSSIFDLVYYCRGFSDRLWSPESFHFQPRNICWLKLSVGIHLGSNGQIKFMKAAYSFR